MSEKATGIRVSFNTPRLPDYISVQICPGTLDEAIANGSIARIPVGQLDEESIDVVIDQWSSAFRTHCEQRRKRQLDKKGETK